ncbi:hypothetical protein OV203_50635 [Nannocystis sp. ILAH1]|nr:hypothetical protein [Nannocystis sp. ILAH1]MCY0995484.1 hypothetical protein [Nannocystis sp. ILAH1]
MDRKLVFWFLVLLTLGAGLLALPGWRPLQAGDLVALVVIGIAGAGGQVALTHAFRLGEASQIAPLEYSGLVWVVLLDLSVWQVLPRP